MVLSAPPVPPAMQRAGYHVHDGFYLRMAAGLGAGHLNISTNSRLANDFSMGGAGLGLNLWIGGTPWRGVALGGLFMVQGVNESNTQVAGHSSHESMNGGIVVLGPFIDAFPDPMRGLHVGGSLGLAGFNAKAEGNALEDVHQVKDYNGGGLAASAWVGYMGFVGPEWSLGGLLQVTALTTNKTEDDIERKASGYALTLSFTALYH